MPNSTGIPANVAIDLVLNDTKNLPGFLAGSSCSARYYDRLDAYSDIDIFTPNPGSYFSMIERLLNRGYRLMDDKFEKQYRRQMRYGFNHWHTNSMKLLHTTTNLEVNIIYKLVDGHETTKLTDVIQSFDWGLLSVLGYETYSGQSHSLAEYLFPNDDPRGPLPMIDYRREAFEQGLMSQYIMQRTPGRYARYIKYGYDLSKVRPVLVQGYRIYADYKSNRSKEEDQLLGEIALALSNCIEDEAIDDLLDFEKQLPLLDSVEQILQSLE